MATKSIIHFKSLSGDILSLSFSPKKSIEQFRKEIAQHISFDQRGEIGSERIIIFPQDSEEQNDSTIPVLEQDQTYSYFIREDHSIHYNVLLDCGPSAYEETEIRQVAGNENFYYSYDLQLIQNSRIIQEFRFYYNPHFRLFFHQDYIKINHSEVSPYHTDHIQILGHPQKIGMSLFDLTYKYLDIPWFNRNIMAQFVQLKWRELEEPYFDDEHFRDFPMT